MGTRTLWRPRSVMMSFAFGRAGQTAEGDHDVVPLGAGGPEAIAAPGRQVAAGDDLVEQGVRVVEEFARGRLAEDRGVLALEFPGEEEELPVDHAAQPGQVWLDDS